MRLITPLILIITYVQLLSSLFACKILSLCIHMCTYHTMLFIFVIIYPYLEILEAFASSSTKSMATTSTTTRTEGNYASKRSSGTCDTTMAHFTSDVSSMKLSTTSADSTTSPNLREGALIFITI